MNSFFNCYLYAHFSEKINLAKNAFTRSCFDALKLITESEKMSYITIYVVLYSSKKFYRKLNYVLFLTVIYFILRNHSQDGI